MSDLEFAKAAIHTRCDQYDARYRPTNFIVVCKQSKWYMLCADGKLRDVDPDAKYLELRRGVGYVEVWSDKLTYLHCVKADWPELLDTFKENNP